MEKTNIEYLMNMTKLYLDGEINSITYSLDFPYEVEKRYKKMLKEDINYAEIIYDYLIEEGVNLNDRLSESEFKKLIEKQYKYIKDAEKDGFI